MGVTSDPSGNARSGATAKGEGCGTLFIPSLGGGQGGKMSLIDVALQTIMAMVILFLLQLVMKVWDMLMGRVPKPIKKADDKFIPEEPDEKWLCPKCKHTNPNDTFKCQQCGYALNK